MGSRYSDEELAFAVLRLEQGCRLGEIAAELGRPGGREGLHGRLSALGLPTTPTRARTVEEQRAAVQAKARELGALDPETLRERVLEAQRRVSEGILSRDAIKARVLQLNQRRAG